MEGSGSDLTPLEGPGGGTGPECENPCRGCCHYRGIWGAEMCHYIFDKGHRRPCPPGKGCTVKAPRRRRLPG